VLRLSAATALALGLVSGTNARAQEIVVRGTVVGPDGRPLALERVLLHRVAGSVGDTVAVGPTAADGRFVLTGPASRDSSAVYFVAARYQGELYIGQPFRPAVEGTPEQVLQVGVQATSASAVLADAEGSAAPMRRARNATNELVFIAPLIFAAAAVLYLIVPRRRVAPQRALLIRIAEIDERLPDAPQGQRESLRDERSRLIAQLRDG
jgi:hypothetical protein